MREYSKKTQNIHANATVIWTRDMGVRSLMLMATFY